MTFRKLVIKIINQLCKNMTLNNTEQIFTLINESNNVLMIADPIFNLDKIASILSLSLFLQKLDKNINIYFQGNIEKKYSFLNVIKIK